MVNRLPALFVPFAAPKCSKLELNNSTKKPDRQVFPRLGFFVIAGKPDAEDFLRNCPCSTDTNNLGRNDGKISRKIISVRFQ